MARAAGASVILVNGRLAAFFRRRNPAIRVFLPEDEPERSEVARQLAQKLAEVAIRYQTRAERAADRDDQRRAGREPFPGAFPGRERVRSDRGGIPDAARRAVGVHPLSRTKPRRRRRTRASRMPEGDTIFRAARTLNRALAGQVVTQIRNAASAARARRLRYAAGGPDGGTRGRGRQVDADVLLGRPDPADAHADERELAHLPAGRTMAARPHSDARGDLHGAVRRGGVPGSRRRVPYGGQPGASPQRSAAGPGRAGAGIRSRLPRSRSCGPGPSSKSGVALLPNR